MSDQNLHDYCTRFEHKKNLVPRQQRKRLPFGGFGKLEKSFSAVVMYMVLPCFDWCEWVSLWLISGWFGLWYLCRAGMVVALVHFSGL